jgi:hypothetical protein
MNQVKSEGLVTVARSIVAVGLIGKGPPLLGKPAVAPERENLQARDCDRGFSASS